MCSPLLPLALRTHIPHGHSWDAHTLSLRAQSTLHSGVQDFSTALKEKDLKYLLDTVGTHGHMHTQTHVNIFSHTFNT